MDFAKAQGLEAEKDEANNVLIRKKATQGKENLATLILQSHVDMVCEKNSDVKFDFEKEIVVDSQIPHPEFLAPENLPMGGCDGLSSAALHVSFTGSNVSSNAAFPITVIYQQWGKSVPIG